ncbi:isochorismatase family protein [Hydrogenophaga sp. MI9]|uniref:isochorismatase family protein n=1 Tax=Hydrogenophaga sp. MI9 TaxID=3453719 RepID=UPI003EEE447E
MATIRSGTQSALLVVDVQVGVVAEAGDVSRQIDHIALAVRKAREAGVPVVWVQHDDEELPKGSAEWQWVPALVPQPNDVRVYKQFNSSFEKTTLESELAARGVSHLVLCGAVSSWCIRATAYGALERGYDLSLIGDAHIAKTMPMGNGETVEAKDIVRELNVVMQWVAYPGRKNRVVTAAELAF